VNIQKSMSNNDLVISAALQAQVNQARQSGEMLKKTEPRAVKAWYELASTRVFIELQNGIVMGFPPQLLQGLESATPEQLAEVEVTPSGYCLYWESQDVDLAVPELVAGSFGTKAWMAELGRQGGKAKSSAKAKSSRENGKRGGRPKKALTSTLVKEN
jgi:hypothetical protein